MARQDHGKSIPVGIIARVVNGVKGFVEGVSGSTWFGPGQPLPPQEQDAYRTWDYPTSVNTQTQTRAYDSLKFDDLRAFADNYDLLRLAIETRKDQMAALQFTIQGREDKFSEAKAKQLKEKLYYPDNENDWASWLRLLIEDLLVIDAPTLYPHLTKGGQLFALDVVDGATIKRVIDAQGRTPLPPSPAYQQILKGVPAVDFSRDELIYRPRNRRPNKIYGYSPVEQIITTVNIALRRQISQLQYYTEGNLPNALINVPETWSIEQIEKFQKYFDALMAGDTANRAKGKFIPAGVKPTYTKEIDLKDEYDEWLARIVMYAFSLPPTPFIKQMNRSTAEAAQETALQEGLGPLKQWVKNLFDYILAKYLGAPEMEFVWQAGEVEQDPLQLAQIHSLYVQNGIMSANEVREEIGLKPQAEPPKEDKNNANEVDPETDE